MKYIVYYDYEESAGTATMFKEEVDTYEEARSVVRSLKQCKFCSNFQIGQVYES